MVRTKRGGAIRHGFTLIELLLVLAILVVLGSMAVAVFGGTQEEADKNAAQAQIGLMKGQIELYKFHLKQYPSELENLVNAPSGDNLSSKWKGPYLDKLEEDPWGNEYRIAAPGKKNPNSYDVWSLGPDGQDGTDDDIGNWDS